MRSAFQTICVTVLYHFHSPSHAMKLVEADLEQSFFQATRKGPDKSIGYLIAGLLVAFFFSIFLFGMQQVQTVSDQVVGDRSRLTNVPGDEIGELSESTAR